MLRPVNAVTVTKFVTVTVVTKVAFLEKIAVAPARDDVSRLLTSLILVLLPRIQNMMSQLKMTQIKGLAVAEIALEQQKTFVLCS